MHLLQSLIDTGKVHGIIAVGNHVGICLKEETDQCLASEDEKG